MNDSSIAGVSVRAILATIIVLCFCALAIMMQKIDMLQDIALVAVSFYFGQKSTNPIEAKNVQVDSTVITKSIPDIKGVKNDKKIDTDISGGPAANIG